MKRIANVRFTAGLNRYVIIPVKMRSRCGKMTDNGSDAAKWRKAKPMRQNDGKRNRCGKMAESEADAAKWRKTDPMRQTDGKCSHCGKMTEKARKKTG